MFTNFGKDRHSAWRDKEQKERESHARLEVIVAGLIAISREIDLTYLNHIDEEKVVRSLSKVHSIEMIEAIKNASLACTEGKNTITHFDLEPDASYAPIDSETYYSAIYSSASAIQAAEALRGGNRISYSISRPPGHHAGRNFYHGFCYFNNAAVAAETLKEGGKKVAILDIDVHHGDGTQDIFYDDPDVFFSSLHADPNIILPHTGKSEERGAGKGFGSTLNLPLPIGIDVISYMERLNYAIDAIRGFQPSYLVLSAGFDTHRFEKRHLPPLTQLDTQDYSSLGEIIGSLNIPICVILEGGYNTELLGDSFIKLIQGLENN